MPPALPDRQFHVELLRSALQTRIVVAAHPKATRIWQLVYVQSGRIEVEVEGPQVGATGADGPALFWHPVRPARAVRLIAGSVGAQVIVDELGISAAIGPKPEADDLRRMADLPVLLPLRARPEVNSAIAQAINVLLREAADTLPGKDILIEAQLRCLLVLMWRHSLPPDGPLSPGADPVTGAGQDRGQTLLLRRFRHLVETHFRSRWRVADYARALGTTPDRLHSVARAALGRTPLALIHDRTLHEARILLSRSQMTLDQIANLLGFHSAAQFSKFFAARAAATPGAYRRSSRQTTAQPEAADPARFRDWP